MLDRLSTRLDRWATGKGILLAALPYLFFAAGILPRVKAAMEAESSGVGPIDLRFAYTPDEAYRMVEAYGEQGRRRYALAESTVDVLYPMSYATFFSLLITFGMRRAVRPDHPLQKARLVPYGTLLADYSENVGIVTMLLCYPARYPALAWLTCGFTIAKWISFASTLLLAIGSLIGAGMATIRSRGK